MCNGFDVESLGFVLNRKSLFILRDIARDADQLVGIMLVSMLDRVDEGFIKGDEEVRLLRIANTESLNALCKVLEHNVHEGQGAGQLELDILSNVADELSCVDET